MSKDELLDLVNEKDEVIGTIWRSKYDPEQSNGCIRAAELFLQNSKGELWIPKRTAHKKIAPNCLDFSAAGHVESGDTYLNTLLRETQEELNLTLEEDNVQKLGKLGPDETGYIREVYVTKTDQEPKYNPEDYVSARWILPEDLVKELDSGVEAKPNLIKALTAFF